MASITADAIIGSLSATPQATKVGASGQHASEQHAKSRDHAPRQHGCPARHLQSARATARCRPAAHLQLGRAVRRQQRVQVGAARVRVRAVEVAVAVVQLDLRATQALDALQRGTAVAQHSALKHPGRPAYLSGKH